MEYIISNFNNKYLYAEKNNIFCYIPELLSKSIEDKSIDDYYKRKFNFLKGYDLFEKEVISFKTRFDDDDIKINLSNLRQLLRVH